MIGFFLHIYYDLIGFFSYILQSDRIFVDYFILFFFHYLLLPTDTPAGPTATTATTPAKILIVKMKAIYIYFCFMWIKLLSAGVLISNFEILDHSF